MLELIQSQLLKELNLSESVNLNNDESFSSSSDKLAEFRGHARNIIDNHKTMSKMDIKEHAKGMVHSIYRTPAINIIDRTPSILGVVRLVLLVGIPFIIHPVLGIVSLLVDIIIKEKVDERYIDTYITDYNDEINAVRKRLIKEKNTLSKDEYKSLSLYEGRLSEEVYKLVSYKKMITAYKVQPKKKQKVKVNKGKLDESMETEFDYLTSEPLLEEENLLILAEFLDMERDIYLSEASGKPLRDIKRKVSSIDRKVSRTIDNTADAVIDGGKKKELKGIQEQILKGRVNASTLLKRAIVAGTAYAVAPALTALGAFVWLVRKGYVKNKKKEQMLSELKAELEIVNEKIKDADSNNDKEKKYQYMRLRRSINESIDKLRFGKTLRTDVQ